MRKWKIGNGPSSPAVLRRLLTTITMSVIVVLVHLLSFPSGLRGRQNLSSLLSHFPPALTLTYRIYIYSY